MSEDDSHLCVGYSHAGVRDFVIQHDFYSLNRKIDLIIESIERLEKKIDGLNKTQLATQERSMRKDPTLF